MMALLLIVLLALLATRLSLATAVQTGSIIGVSRLCAAIYSILSLIITRFSGVDVVRPRCRAGTQAKMKK